MVHWSRPAGRSKGNPRGYWPWLDRRMVILLMDAGSRIRNPAGTRFFVPDVMDLPLSCQPHWRKVRRARPRWRFISRGTCLYSDWVTSNFQHNPSIVASQWWAPTLKGVHSGFPIPVHWPFGRARLAWWGFVTTDKAGNVVGKQTAPHNHLGPTFIIKLISSGSASMRNDGIMPLMARDY